ncbi:odorant receptor 4-like [Linepithema humile]|uniref:odorant receptor 4-like n=1 Tax=Linepithema humile TaxID=83485 RepID=UPI00351DCBC3
MNRSNDAWKKEDAVSLKYYIANLLVVFGYARIWPDESFVLCKIFFSTAATATFISANFVLLLSEIAALTMSNSLELFANIIGVICMHAVGLIKWCYCINKKREVVDLVMKLEKCHVLCQRIDRSERGSQIFANEMEYARRYSSFFIWWWLCTCIYGVLHWCANPLVLKSGTPGQINSTIHTFTERGLPFIAWYPMNTNDNYNYICLYLLQVIGGLSSALGIVCYDAFYITMLIIICTQFQYINTILTTDPDNVSKAQFILERKLRNCVDCHTEIIEFLQMLQTFMGPTMFVQCIETLVIICLVSFEASTIKIAMDMESILKLWALFEYFLCASVQLFSFCFSATRLQYLGLQVAYSVFSCGWELEKGGQWSSEKQLKHRDTARLVQTITLQAQRPIVLTGGPFYTLSLETFRAIISMAISNSVMLRTISDENI